ncbi:unnamed protein product, partial [marine sediment metagenome]
PIIDLKRVAIDIEINMNPDEKRIPDPSKSNNKIISISFVGIDGLKKVYVLEREGFSMGEKIEEIPDDLEIVFFEDEKDLLIETFRILWKYPVVITFNGDNFDLNYIFHRAKKLKISEQLNNKSYRLTVSFLTNPSKFVRSISLSRSFLLLLLKQ